MIRFPPQVPVLTTERLELTATTDEDAADYFALCSDPEVMRLHGLAVHKSVEETRKLIRFLQEEFFARRMIRWGVRRRGEKKLLGDVGYWRFVPSRRRAEAGAKLAQPQWSKGYMTEALRAVFAYGFHEMGLHSIEGNADLENRASLRLIEKLGFEKEGRIREHSYCPYREKFVDTLLFSFRKEHLENV